MNPNRTDAPVAVLHTVAGNVGLRLPSAEDHISRHLLLKQSWYEQQYLEALGRYLSAGDLVLDIGANIGNHSLFFAKVCRCRVISYEAVPSTAQLLRENVDLNDAGDTIDVRAVGLGAEPANARLDAFDEANVGGARLSLDRAGNLELSAIDAEAIAGPVRCIKIDVEGMELDVLRGAEDLIGRDRPLIGVEAATDDEYRQLQTWAQSHGYLIADVFNATPTYLMLPCNTPAEMAEAMRHQAETIRNLRREVDRFSVSNTRQRIGRMLGPRLSAKTVRILDRLGRIVRFTQIRCKVAR